MKRPDEIVGMIYELTTDRFEWVTRLHCNIFLNANIVIESGKVKCQLYELFMLL